MNEEQLIFYHLGAALAIGLLIGTERGWKDRKYDEGERIAGVRTHGLIGLLGGAAALLAQRTGPLALGLTFLGLAAVFVSAYVVSLRRADDVGENLGITSLVAELLAFLLGALAGLGEVAGAAAVVTTLLLSYKPVLHRWLQALKAGELNAGIKLLLISVFRNKARPAEERTPPFAKAATR